MPLDEEDQENRVRHTDVLRGRTSGVVLVDVTDLFTRDSRSGSPRVSLDPTPGPYPLRSKCSSTGTNLTLKELLSLTRIPSRVEDRESWIRSLRRT